MWFGTTSLTIDRYYGACAEIEQRLQKTSHISLLVNISYSLWQELHVKKQWGPYPLLKILLFKKFQDR